jgi:hypothetical protein
MKTIIVLAFAFALSIVSRAGEYVTLNSGKLSLALNATDVVQIVGVLQNPTSPTYCEFVFSGGGPITKFDIPPVSSSGGVPTQFNNIVMTGLSQVRLPSQNGANVAVTLHITKPNEQLTSEPLVVPLAQGTTYAVALETSTDLQNWVPALPGDYVSTSTARFFRVKAAVSPGAP